jgi:hypothetical protein
VVCRDSVIATAKDCVIRFARVRGYCNSERLCHAFFLYIISGGDVML